MAGNVGAGGLGDIASRHGYQRYMVDVMIATIVILICPWFKSFRAAM